MLNTPKTAKRKSPIAGRTFHSDFTRRLLRQEEFIAAVTVALSLALEKSGTTKSQLALKLGRNKSFVTQVLSGERNLTLRTIADFADALGMRPEFDLSPIGKKKQSG